MGPHPTLTIRTPPMYESSSSKHSTATYPTREIWHPIILYTVFIHAMPMATSFVGGLYVLHPYIWLFLAHNVLVGIYVLHLIAYQIYEPTSDVLKYEFFLDSIYSHVLLTLYETVWLVVSGTRPLGIICLCVVRMVIAYTNRQCTANIRNPRVLLWHATDASHRMCLIGCVIFAMLSMT